MRNVKKSLKALDKPDPDQTPEEQVSNTRRCLVKIGRHIDSLLEDMTEDKAREWRSHLWYFVSNFTEFDAKKLFKLYRHAMKKDGHEEDSDGVKREETQKEGHKEKEHSKDKEHGKEKDKKKHRHKDKERSSSIRKSQEE